MQEDDPAAADYESDAAADDVGDGVDENGDEDGDNGGNGVEIPASRKMMLTMLTPMNDSG